MLSGEDLYSSRPLSSPRPGRVGRLDLAGKLAQPAVRDLVLRDRTVSGHAPIVVELDPTSFCDSVCPECISQELLQTTRFSRERLVSLSEELVAAGVRAVILIGGGEPLAHPGVSDTIRVLADGGLQVGLTTSGTLLDLHLPVVAEHASWTRVSVDAATPSTYERVRPHRSKRNMFGRVTSAMAALAESKTGSLGFSFVMISRDGGGAEAVSNLEEIEAAALLARSLGCDYFEVKPIYDMDHFLVSVGESDLQAIEEQVQAIQALASPDFEVIAPVTLDEILAGRHQQEKDYEYCPVTELRTLLTSSGAYLCPYHRGNPRARYGDPNSQSFVELWREAPKVAGNIVPSRDCRFHCIRHETNLLVPTMRSGADVRPATAVNEPDLFI